jgi:peroxiredoxin
MKKIFAPLVLLVSALALSAVAAPPRASDDSAPAPLALGTVVEDFRLPDADGRAHSLASLKGRSGTALIFFSVQCPVCNAYNERLEKLYAEYRARGIAIVGIDANSDETAEQVRSFVREKRLSFPLLRDPGNKIADRFGAAHTPEVFFLDAGGRLVYHGAIDNSMNPQMINASHLRNAIEAVLAGKQIERADVKAFGCSIKRTGTM